MCLSVQSCVPKALPQAPPKEQKKKNSSAPAKPVSPRPLPVFVLMHLLRTTYDSLHAVRRVAQRISLLPKHGKYAGPPQAYRARHRRPVSKVLCTANKPCHVIEVSSRL